MMNIWIGDPDQYFLGKRSKDPPAKIIGSRAMDHADLPNVERLIRPETYEIFGDLAVERIFETSCHSMVQWNEKGEIVSGICICNYPNVPSVIPEDWVNWLYKLYRPQQVSERNSMFVHMLVWDSRYTGHFFKKLLSGLFDVTSYLEYILIVIPPRIILDDIFEKQMIKIPLNSENDHPSYQSIYMTDRFLKKPRLKIRRVVEEDNDDVVSIIDAETPLLKEFYGEFYVSEMIRNPDGCRKLIISEEDDKATGVMFINKNIDVDTLIDNFQLVPYNGLKKPHKKDLLPEEYMRPDSETFFSFFKKKSWDIESEGSSMIISPEESIEEDAEDEATDQLEMKKLEDPSMISFISDLPRITRQFSMYYESKMESSAFVESLFHVPRQTMVTSIIEDIQLEKIHIPEQPVYHGQVNAFVLEIFAMKHKMKLRESRNFIEAAFESFPDLEYCAILLPSNHVFIPLLHHFMRVPSKCNKDYPMSLYLTHRAALLGMISVHVGKPLDKLTLKKFLKRIRKSEHVLRDFDKATIKKHPDTYSYIFKWNDKIIGVIIIRVEDETMYIKRRYHIEDYIAIQNIPPNAYARILHFILMPIFSIHTPYIFSEISRLSGFFVFYYRLEERSLSSLTRTHPLPICLTVMIPVYPRRRIKYRYHNLVETDRKPKKKTESFSLFLTTPRLSMMLGNIVDSKIVVVGASDCGVAFAEELALGCNFIKFANLTLISPNGLPFDNDHNDLSHRMIPFTGRYCRKYRRELPTRVWVNIVYGTVITINRKEKYVTVLHQGNITYDYLILTCGMQYQKPKFQEELELEKKGQFLDVPVPWNMLTINDDTEAAVCLDKIKKQTDNLKKKKTIIFYGHNINCYCALQGLLEFGVDGSWITLIHPPLIECSSHDEAFFSDCEVYTEVMEAITRNNITIIMGWELINWKLEDTSKGKMIESIVIKSKGKSETIGCDFLINFNEKTIGMKIFLAICRSGLMFDGQLVIDSDLRTNDPSIFAAGTITKYCRRYYSDSWEHKYFNRMEIGEKLAKIIRSFIENEHQGKDPASIPSKRKAYESIYVFRLPLIVACIVPDGYRFLYVRKCGKGTPRKIAIRFNIYGQVLITGCSKSSIGYFRIRLNQFNMVETITCFNRKNFEVDHMCSLWGKHESMLNNLKTRFKESLIVDFFEYFREPWALAIFYDKFNCLRVENRATLLSKTAISGQSLINDCVHALIRSKWDQIQKSDLQTIQSRFAGSVYQQEIEENLLDFLQFCQDDLPVYCTPDRLNELYEDNKDSRLYNVF